MIDAHWRNRTNLLDHGVVWHEQTLQNGLDTCHPCGTAVLVNYCSTWDRRLRNVYEGAELARCALYRNVNSWVMGKKREREQTEKGGGGGGGEGREETEGQLAKKAKVEDSTSASEGTV